MASHTGHVGVTAAEGQPTAERVDHAALFAATPSSCLVLSPELLIVGVSEAYCRATGRSREELRGVFFDAFPGIPDDPQADGVRNLSASPQRADQAGSGHHGRAALRRPPGRPGVSEKRRWSPVDTPVLGPGGQVAWIIHRAEDVTPINGPEQRQPDGPGPRTRRLRGMKAEL